MTIDEAIKENEDSLSLFRLFASLERVEAMNLGIEALKREKERRHSIYWAGAALLPGETEE